MLRPVRWAASLLLVPLAASACGTTNRTVTVVKRETRTVTAAKRATRPPRVFVPQFNQLVYKPDLIGLGASSDIEHIRWATYGYATAVGLGVFPKNDCSPDCARGHITPVKVTVRLTRRVLCRGVLVYELWAIKGGPFKGDFDAISPESRC